MAGSQRGASSQARRAASRMTVDIDGILDAVGANFERPEGSVTARELAESKGWMVSRARNALNKAVALGHMEMTKGPNGLGGAPCCYYTPTEKEAK